MTIFPLCHLKSGDLADFILDIVPYYFQSEIGFGNLSSQQDTSLSHLISRSCNLFSTFLSVASLVPGFK